MIGALIAAGVLGLAEREGIRIPHFGAVGEAGTIGIAAVVAARSGLLPANMRRIAEHAATGLLSIAVYDFARTAGGASAAKQPTTSGSDDVIETRYEVR